MIRSPSRRRSPRRSSPAGGGARRVTGDKKVVVVGGGLAGLAAATVLAERGVSVTVVERERYLGGRLGAWEDVLRDGSRFQMERGFHAFFRQYYNLRNLLRRIDPGLSFLKRLEDYPLLGPDGSSESFENLPRHSPLNIAELVRRSDHLSLSDLRDVAFRPALAMLAYHEATTYRRFDGRSAASYLDSLNFPSHARRMLFDVFSHSFFNPEDQLSAAELLMNFHFYFVGNPEGLVFDVATAPFSTAIVDPLTSYLERRGVRFVLGTSVERVVADGGTYRVEAREALEGDGVVLALHVPGLKAVVSESPTLGTAVWRSRIEALSVTAPFAVHRVWLDRPVGPNRAPFVGTTGLGLVDNISVYERFQRQSQRWAERTGGSVVELHAYAVPADRAPASVRRELLESLHALYPETREANVVEDRFFMREDCPAFGPGSYEARPTPETTDPGLVLAGDFLRIPFPSALMERAVASGFLAANHLLRRWHGHQEPLETVPLRGLLSGLRSLAA